MTFAPSLSAVASGLGLNARLRLAAAGAVTALAALAPAAHAVVVVSPVSNLSVPVTTAGIYINVINGVTATAPAGAPGWDLNPWGTGSAFIYAASGGGAIVTTGTAVTSLAAGTTIGATSTFTQNATAATAANGWVLGANNYFGFRFVNEATGLTHYGYGIYSLGPTFTDPARKIVSLFYEGTAGASITIPTAVPEPGTWALMLGGLALAGGIARRRKAG